MGTFGEELRMERVARGIALEHITAVTKISQHHLVALEQNRFRQLPGGIICKGIIRGYADAIGLDQQNWTDRFLKAYNDSGLVIEDQNWSAFASNVGRSRLRQREAMELRLRWLGAGILLIAVSFAAFLLVRYYGVRAGWWTTFLPSSPAFSKVQDLYASTRTWVIHLFA